MVVHCGTKLTRRQPEVHIPQDRLTVVFSAALFALACDANTDSRASTAAIPEWRLADTPRVSIGVADGDDHYMFRRITGVIRRADGTVFVSDVEPSFSMYDSLGRFVKSLGRRGSGPGEFELLFTMPFVYRGDSIAIWDFGQRRVNIFDATGTFGRTVTVLVPRVHWPRGTRPAESCCRIAASLSDGSFVLQFPAAIPSDPGPSPYATVTLARVSPDGMRSDTIGTYNDYRYWYATAAGRSRQIRLTMRFEYAVIGDTVIGGNGEGPWLLRTVRGARADTVRVEMPMIPVTDSLRAAYAQAYRDEYARNPRIFEGPPDDLFDGEYAPFAPAYSRVLADDAGRVWLRQWTLPFNREPGNYRIYTTRGVPVARIKLPADTWIVHAGADHVTLVESDSDGVPYVRVYDIIKPQ